MHGISIVEDIERCVGHKLDPELGLLIIDFGAYFPYSNQEVLNMNIEFLTDLDETFVCLSTDDKKLNHRYANNGYVTLSRVCSRRVCKSGYFWYKDLVSLNRIKYIRFGYDMNHQMLYFIVPVVLKLDAVYNSACLTIHLDLKELNTPDFTVFSHQYFKDEHGIIGWHCSYYTTKDFDSSSVNYVALKIDENLTSREHHIVVYQTEIELPRCDYDGLVL